ncbi:UDP-2,3-diacylglucosamine diphosphatase [Dokdonella koreensis]|uniref:Ser/Thr protein phosphatase family protein, UDP-2,3-diacylglucosamine hydrolase-like protein n=1 Tax=Dokdonella koreensis DS-123 TaxID=1300342 RepID=A0A160DRR5_9GAMM|nr:UDP-2,3-diacylglucosamine diphosphatase [Dokdonella koreensis]ANB16907.1 Ser/Thr protein phosphatase family protein, UDP-2,3-diacylglucosamine hydrolase-like protein [Dokdonella koreensis DS-123]
MNIHRVRSVFISDVHLGTRACQAERLLGFLRAYPAEYLYLVGDIVDFWAMRRDVRWTAAQNTVVQKILRRARHGEQVIFIPGNHDEALREYTGIRFGDIRLEREWVHTTAEGKRYLVLHGDEFDQVTRYHRWLAVLGDVGYTWLVHANGWLSWLRRKLGIAGYWSLAGYAKRKVKAAVSFVGDFEGSVARAVRERGLDGVICGHIHVAALRDIEGIRYVNCGDWVDSCTAIVEHHDGRLELIHWSSSEAETLDPEGLAEQLLLQQRMQSRRTAA